MYSILVHWEGADCSNVVAVVVSLMTVCVTRRDSACCRLLIVILSPIIIPVLCTVYWYSGRVRTAVMLLVLLLV